MSCLLPAAQLCEAQSSALTQQHCPPIYSAEGTALQPAAVREHVRLPLVAAVPEQPPNPLRGPLGFSGHAQRCCFAAYPLGESGCRVTESSWKVFLRSLLASRGTTEKNRLHLQNAALAQTRILAL